MNYPMKDGQIDPEFLEKVAKQVNEDVRHSELAFVSIDTLTDVLLAAQEVMQESLEIKVGDRVRMGNERGVVYQKHDAFGHQISDQRYADVLFDNGMYGEFNKAYLTKIEEAQHGES